MVLADKLPAVIKILDDAALGLESENEWSRLGFLDEGRVQYWDVDVSPAYVRIKAAVRRPSETQEDAFAAGIALRDALLAALGVSVPQEAEVSVISVPRATDQDAGPGWVGAVALVIAVA